MDEKKQAEFILCNDKVCEGDQAVNRIEDLLEFINEHEMGESLSEWDSCNEAEVKE